MRPVFIDNRDGNTLQKAITAHLHSLRKAGATPEELCISTAYFNPQGLELLAGEAEHIGRIRLLLGVEPTRETLTRRRNPDDPPEPKFTRVWISNELEKLEKGLRTDRDLLPFDPATDRAVRRLLGFLRSGKVESRRYRGHFLHAKAFLFRGPDRGILSGSSNLTAAGLRTNLELNFGFYDDPLVGKVEEWFDELWDEAEPFDLAAIYEELLQEYPPYLIYLKVLWQLYGDELRAEEEAAGRIPITTFQKHGVWRARRILEKYGGVLIADGVGLGKTFLAGELIRGYRDRRQRVLLICPASLRDSVWQQFLHDYQLFVDTVSYEQLARDAQLGGERTHLKSALEEYALVVIDEAHNYRNPDAPSRAAVLRRLLSGKRRDLVLLTATPVNNSLWDLYHLLRYFLKQDAALAKAGVLSVRERFVEAMRVDPYNLNPDLLYPVIDSTTVKRTRQFVKKHYSADTIKGPDGALVPIVFPVPRASSIRYNLDEALPGFFDRFKAVLMPEEGEPLLKMARYKPENYPKSGSLIQEEPALVGLIRSGLLKRFESSIFAFCKTLKKMAREHETFLDALRRGVVIRKEFLREFSAADDEAEIEALFETSENIEDAASYDVAALSRDVERDLELLRELHDTASTVRPDDSPKLAAVVEELVKIVEQARSESFDEEDERQKRKVIIFSFFEDTIDWLEENLTRIIEADDRLACYRGRIASVSGTDSRNGVRREDAIHGFAPESTEAPPGKREDRFDLLLSTDVLAEGMNLQQCRNIINYDLPWNPMRLVQRHGRIDRIRSPHKEVFLRTVFPDDKLDDLLDLVERVQRKIAQAAASVGVEASPIEHGRIGEQSFSETQSAAQTGEEYRQELRKALERQPDEIKNLPWRIGSGMVRGERRGHFFCAAVGDLTFLRFVPFGGGEEDIVTEVGTCLRLIECDADTERFMPRDLEEAAYEAWEKARKSVHAAWMYQTDPANLQPKISKLNREVAEFIRVHPPKDMDQGRINRCLDSVESPWSRREENQLRDVFRQEITEPAEKSRMLIEAIEEIGIEPFEAPKPLPPIKEEEIHLVCWMALEAVTQEQP